MKLAGRLRITSCKNDRVTESYLLQGQGTAPDDRHILFEEQSAFLLLDLYFWRLCAVSILASRDWIQRMQ